jgi:hypothetical protein
MPTIPNVTIRQATETAPELLAEQPLLMNVVIAPAATQGKQHALKIATAFGAALV